MRDVHLYCDRCHKEAKELFFVSQLLLPKNEVELCKDCLKLLELLIPSVFQKFLEEVK